ncbi:hypothetical protein ACFQ6V_09195 [Streptomyces roseifaciens]
MRQRNDTMTSWTFAASPTAEAYTVAPGQSTEHPVLLTGWTPVGAEDEGDHGRTADEPPPAKARPKKTSTSATADSDDPQGGEPR